MAEQAVDNICLQSFVISCPCGENHRFKIEISNGADGNTQSLWLTCGKCKAARVMRKIMKEITFQ